MVRKNLNVSLKSGTKVHHFKESFYQVCSKNFEDIIHAAPLIQILYIDTNFKRNSQQGAYYIAQGTLLVAETQLLLPGRVLTRNAETEFWVKQKEQLLLLCQAKGCPEDRVTHPGGAVVRSFEVFKKQGVIRSWTVLGWLASR